MSDDEISKFDLFSPTDFRYVVEGLRPFLSEEAFIEYKSEIEAKLARVKAKRCVISQNSADAIAIASKRVRAKDVYAEEAKTKHDIIAQVNITKRELPDEFRCDVHVPATSYDKVDTANAMRYLDVFEEIIIPDMVELEKCWIDAALSGKDIPQIGRTHLQHAEPITYGFAIAWYVSRFGKRILKINEAIKQLEGKFSGAVGAYNSSALFFDDPESFEEDIMSEVGLKPCEISTQIIQPEQLTDLMHYVTSALSILANWADDMRNLERPEIAEVGQPRGGDISTSSTMPHKINPVGLENIKSMWKLNMPFMVTMYMDQISDHQRDLTNSATQRYIPDVLVRFDYAVSRAAKIAKELKPHVANMVKNLAMSADKIIAEPLHILLSSYGHPDSHNYVKRLTEKSYTSGIPLTQLVFEDMSLKSYLDRFTEKQMEILKDPLKYMGIASKKAEKVAYAWKNRLIEAKLLPELQR
jgi:adenylosuccinate lyase